MSTVEVFKQHRSTSARSGLVPRLGLPSKAHRIQRRGAYVVEMALALPVIFLVTFSGFELMYFFKARHTANQAAYAAARQLVVPGGRVEDAYAAANRIAEVHMLQVDAISVTPEVITRDTRQVTVEINIRFLSEWSFARLFAGQSIIARCTLAHENRSIFLD